MYTTTNSYITGMQNYIVITYRSLLLLKFHNKFKFKKMSKNIIIIILIICSNKIILVIV